jgi:hypothetical protein
MIQIKSVRTEWNRLLVDGVDALSTGARGDGEMAQVLAEVARLRAEEEPDRAYALAAAGLDRLVAQPELARSPALPLLVTGILGWQPSPEEGFARWWLWADLPIRATGLPFGPGQVSLHAHPDEDWGPVVQVSTTVPLTLEILTPHTLYLEVLPPGSHEITLTVIDRTGVRG